MEDRVEDGLSDSADVVVGVVFYHRPARSVHIGRRREEGNSAVS